MLDGAWEANSSMIEPETGILSDEIGIRVAFTKRFPYSIMFTYLEPPPFILTVYHQSRHSDAWKTRIRKKSS